VVPYPFNNERNSYVTIVEEQEKEIFVEYVRHNLARYPFRRWQSGPHSLGFIHSPKNKLIWTECLEVKKNVYKLPLLGVYSNL
jgi:hypothetical protein